MRNTNFNVQEKDNGWTLDYDQGGPETTNERGEIHVHGPAETGSQVFLNEAEVLERVAELLGIACTRHDEEPRKTTRLPIRPSYGGGGMSN